MMDLVPENLNGAVVLNLTTNAACTDNECRDCLDISGVIHNWLMLTELHYLIIDLQDEKDVCATFLIEILQLRKRLRYPILFAGVMEKARRVLESYNYTSTATPLFITPEDAVRYMEDRYPALLNTDLSQVVFGEPIALTRVHQSLRAGAEVPDEGLDAADL